MSGFFVAYFAHIIIVTVFALVTILTLVLAAIVVLFSLDLGFPKKFDVFLSCLRPPLPRLMIRLQNQTLGVARRRPHSGKGIPGCCVHNVFMVRSSYWAMKNFLLRSNTSKKPVFIAMFAMELPMIS